MYFIVTSALLYPCKVYCNSSFRLITHHLSRIAVSYKAVTKATLLQIGELGQQVLLCTVKYFYFMWSALVTNATKLLSTHPIVTSK